MLIGQLAEEWWGEPAARRAILFWCFFPGTIVFSMVYTRGPDADARRRVQCSCCSASAGCGAGLLRGFSTAIAPVALAAVPMCAVAAWQEIRARGWDDREARRSLIAPILSPLGAIGFGIFLWFWAGTPFADYHGPARRLVGVDDTARDPGCSAR